MLEHCMIKFIGGTRRIVLSRLWDFENSQVSFARLSNLALKHSTLLRPNLHCAIITYTDVDGDTITISTHRELKEAFEEFMNHPSNTDMAPIVLRAQVVFIKQHKCQANAVIQKNIELKYKAGVAMQKATEDNSEDNVRINSEDNVKMNSMTDLRYRRGMKWVQLQLVLDSLVSSMTVTVEKLTNDVDEMRSGQRDQAANDDTSTVKTNESVRRRNGKRRNLEMQALLDSFVTNMTETVEKLSQDVEKMRPRKRGNAAIAEVGETENSSNTDKSWKRGNGKRRNFKMQIMLDSLVTNMTETVQKLAKDVTELQPRKGEGGDVAEIVSVKESVNNAQKALVSGDESTDVVHTADVVSTSDVAMEGHVSWDAVP